LNDISIRSAVALGVLAAPTAVALSDEGKPAETPTSAAVPEAPVSAELRISSRVRGDASRREARRHARAARRARARRRARTHRKRAGAYPAAAAHRTAPPAAQSTAPPALGVIATCESRGNPSAVSGGGTYRGKYQFDWATWASVGGVGDPAAAPEAEQDARAAILYARAGSSPWPVCGR
jgi:hypothetical protein